MTTNTSAISFERPIAESEKYITARLINHHKEMREESPSLGARISYFLRSHFDYIDPDKSKNILTLKREQAPKGRDAYLRVEEIGTKISDYFDGTPETKRAFNIHSLAHIEDEQERLEQHGQNGIWHHSYEQIPVRITLRLDC